MAGDPLILPGSRSPYLFEYILSYVWKHVIICYRIHYFVVVPLVAGGRYLIDSGVHARSGDVQVQLLHPVDNSRCLRILKEICRLPGGCHRQYPVRVFHRMHRCFHRYNPVELGQLILCCWFGLLFVQALCHQVYGLPHHNYSYARNYLKSDQLCIKNTARFVNKSDVTKKDYSPVTSHAAFSFMMKHFLIFRKYIQCRIRWIIINAVNARLVTLCMLSHWLRGMFRNNDQLFPRPPPEGRTR